MTVTDIALPLVAGLAAAAAAAFAAMRLDLASGRRGKSFYARWLAKRYRERFEEQLVDGLTSMANALRAGFSVNQAFESVSELDLHPLSDEFALLLKQMRVGMNFDDALTALDDRIGSEDLTLVVTAIDISRKTGGNLAEIFDLISGTIRGRMRIARRVKTLTAQGRLQGLIVSLMPFVLGGAMTMLKPDMMVPFFKSWIGMACVVLACGLVVAGWIVIRKIVRIDV